jgi:predicted outer membrane repeat protein
MQRTTYWNVWFILLACGTLAIGATIHVGPDQSIQAAIGQAQDGDEIEVAPGIYRERIDFTGKAVRLYSRDGAEATTIDCRIPRIHGSNEGSAVGTNAAGTGSVVKCVKGEDAATVLEGFTIAGGRAVNGGGMYNIGSSPTIIACIFEDNAADSRGGGIYNRNGHPTVTGCTFRANSALEADGGGMTNDNSSPVVADCVFIENFALDGGGGMHNRSQSHPIVTGCTFDGNLAANGGGMQNLSDSSPTVTNCRFTGNSAEGGNGGGIDNTYDSHPIVTSCVFEGNSARYGGAMLSGWGSNPLITDCLFAENSAQWGGGMFNVQTSTRPVTNCTFWGNLADSSGGAIYSDDCDMAVTNSIVWGNVPDSIRGSAVVTYSAVDGGWAGVGNVAADPLLVGGGNYRLQTGSPCLDAGNNTAVSSSIDLDGDPRIQGAAVDMGAFEGATFCVNRRGSIQAAIDAALDGDEIEVAPGTYYERINFDGKAIRLYSRNGAEATILHGRGAGSVVECVKGEDAATVLEGFTITGGRALNGGGMYNVGSSPTIIGCIFEGNTADSRGGGMYNRNGHPTVTGCTFLANLAPEADGGGMTNDNSSPLVADCVFIENFALDGGGGMHNRSQSHPTVTSCVFEENVAEDGGGMQNFVDSHPTITDCTFAVNSAAGGNGGGIDNTYDSNPAISHCVFEKNAARYGGAILSGWGSDPSITDCLFAHNSAQWGGAMFNVETRMRAVTNCTFRDNMATSNGGAIYNDDSEMAVTNSIVWGNVPDSIRGSAVVTYSDIEGSWVGLGNIAVNPIFVGDADCRLQVGSPCLDAGDNGAVFSLIDLDGNARIQCAAVDMGAFERNLDMDAANGPLTQVSVEKR